MNEVLINPRIAAREFLYAEIIPEKIIRIFGKPGDSLPQFAQIHRNKLRMSHFTNTFPRIKIDGRITMEAILEILKPYYYTALAMTGIVTASILTDSKSNLIVSTGSNPLEHILALPGNPASQNEPYVLLGPNVLSDLSSSEIITRITDVVAASIGQTLSMFVKEDARDSEKMALRILDVIAEFKRVNYISAATVAGDIAAGIGTAQNASQVAVDSLNQAETKPDDESHHHVIATLQNLITVNTKLNVEVIEFVTMVIKEHNRRRTTVERIDTPSGHYYKYTFDILTEISNSSDVRSPKTTTYGCPFRQSLVNWLINELEIGLRNSQGTGS